MPAPAACLQAFETFLAQPGVKALAANPEVLHKILAYHVVKGSVILPAYKGNDTLTLDTLLGQPLNVTKARAPGARGCGAKGRGWRGEGGECLTQGEAAVSPATISASPSMLLPLGPTGARKAVAIVFIVA